MLQLNDTNFEVQLQQYSNMPLLVDCWTARCEACRYNAPVADELAKEFGDRLLVGKLNVDESPYTIGIYQIHVVPVMLLFDAGRLIYSFRGIISKEMIKSVLVEHKLL